MRRAGGVGREGSLKSFAWCALVAGREKYLRNYTQCMHYSCLLQNSRYKVKNVVRTLLPSRRTQPYTLYTPTHTHTLADPVKWRACGRENTSDEVWLKASEVECAMTKGRERQTGPAKPLIDFSFGYALSLDSSVPWPPLTDLFPGHANFHKTNVRNHVKCQRRDGCNLFQNQHPVQRTEQSPQ